jgi:hypothetical protein
MTPFQYVDFYDVPRTIILPVRGKWVLPQSSFNTELDDYEVEYSVYRLPSSFQPPQAGCKWDFLGEVLACVGKIPVREVQFDDSKRRTLSAASLDEIVPD